jgi:hypothetical protein
MNSSHEFLFVLSQNLGVRLKTKMLNLDITCVEFKRLDRSLDSNNIDRSAVCLGLLRESLIELARNKDWGSELLGSSFKSRSHVNIWT